MKFATTAAVVLSMALSVAAQSSEAAAILKTCGDARNACNTAPNANHAYCAATYFSCISPTEACDCPAKSSACLTNPPTGNLFDCAPALAECVVSCKTTVAATSTTTFVTPASSTAPVISASPTKPSNGTVVTPTISAKPSATSAFTGAGSKAGLSVVGVMVAGAALFL